MVVTTNLKSSAPTRSGHKATATKMVSIRSKSWATGERTGSRNKKLCATSTLRAVALAAMLMGVARATVDDVVDEWEQYTQLERLQGKRWTNYYCKMTPKEGKFGKYGGQDTNCMRQVVEMKFFEEAGDKMPKDVKSFKQISGTVSILQACGPNAKFMKGRGTVGLKIHNTHSQDFHVKFQTAALRDAFIAKIKRAFIKSSKLYSEKKQRQIQQARTNAKKYLNGDDDVTFEQAKSGLDRIMSGLGNIGSEKNKSCAFKRLTAYMKSTHDQKCMYDRFNSYWTNRVAESRR